MFFGDKMLNYIEKILWAIATSLILISGIYFSIMLKFPQLNLKKMLIHLFSKKKQKEGISPFSTLMLTLGGRIGVGSVAGVALAIYYGGVGSIFWMWVIAIISASTTFVETILGIIYREKDDNNNFKGGPSFYIKKGLKKEKLGILYAMLIIVSYIGGFLSIQTNTITRSLQQICFVPSYVVGIILVAGVALIIFGGLKKILNVMTKIVPCMTILYILFCLTIIVQNYNKIPDLFVNIITSAFNLKTSISGFFLCIVIGIQRGIFSNEAGLGTGSIASSTVSSDNTVEQGYIQILGIYITTLLICTLTALVIMCSNYNNIIFSNINGIEITQYAFSSHFGKIGDFSLFIFILLFSFSTILTGYYYGESSLKFLFPHISKKNINILKNITLIILFLGCIMSATLIWKLVDIAVAILAIINIYALLSLKNVIKDEVYCHKN